jgi:hypothetical protein
MDPEILELSVVNMTFTWALGRLGDDIIMEDSPCGCTTGWEFLTKSLLHAGAMLHQERTKDYSINE